MHTQPAEHTTAQTVDAPVHLSTGRIIAHYRLANGAQAAVPTHGATWMTDAEYEEYCGIVRERARQAYRTFVYGGRIPGGR
jgi:hypothetical protein